MAANQAPRPTCSFAQGGHGSGAVAVLGLLVVLAPDGVAGPVLQIRDPPVPPGVGGDLGRGQVGAAGGHEHDLLAERLYGRVGDVAADDRQAGGVRQADARPGRGVGVGGPGGPAVDPVVPTFFGDVAGFGGDQIAACGDGRGVQRRPVSLDRQQVIGGAVLDQVAGGLISGTARGGLRPIDWTGSSWVSSSEGPVQRGRRITATSEVAPGAPGRRARHDYKG